MSVRTRGTRTPNDLRESPNGLEEKGHLWIPPESPHQKPQVEPKTSVAPHGAPARVVSGAPQRYKIIGRWLSVTDALCIIATLLVSHRVRWGLAPMADSYLIVVALVPLLWIPIFRSYSLHQPQVLSSWEEFRRTISAASVGMVVVVMASFWTKFEFSRTWVGITWIFVILLELITHRVWREYIHKRKLDGRLTLRTLVVGTNPDAVQLIGSLQKPASGFEVVGIVETQDFDIPFDDVPLVGRIDDLLKSIYRYGIDCLFMAGPRLEEQDMLKVTQTARQQNAEIRVAANLPEIIGPRLNVQPMGGIMTLSLKPVQLSGVEAVVKRVFDLVVGGFVLLLSLPVLLVVALAIKLGSKGPVFFTQARVTKGGHPFKMFKFRTMSEDADRILEEESVDSTAPFFKLGEDDPRVTPVGGFLRRFSLDELPQLINVIKGEMSLVGPRPLPADQVAANLDLLGPRHEVPAGVTGWWQIQGRSDVGPEEAVRMDLFYIENWSLALDLYVLLKTVGVVMAKKGAY